MRDKTHYNNDNEFAIVLYKTAKGKIPFDDFIKSLEMKMAVNVFRAIDKLKSQGNHISVRDSKKIADGIFELRIKHSSNILRVFYFFYSGKEIVLLNGFVKKSTKTPRKELEKAIKYRKDWLRRVKNDI